MFNTWTLRISVIIESNQRAKTKNTKVELKEVSQPVEKVLAMARNFYDI